jgi:hypothetical protein
MVIVPMVGLAVDLSMLYLIRTRLLSATDAAVLAGARALSQGADAATQKSNAQTAATKFFNANFPAGYWGSSNLNFPAVTVDDTSVANYRSITATATVNAPLYFLRILGQDHSTLRADAQAGRRDALVVLVLDRSSSMGRDVAGTGQTACDIMKVDAKEFIKHFAVGRDMLGLVVFASGAFTYQSRANFTTADTNGNTINSIIDAIACGDNTASAEAMHDAYDEITRVYNITHSTARANVIVFMTDGIPNGVTGNFISYRISPCGTTGTPMIGVLAQWANNDSTGVTAGLMARSAPDVYTPTKYSEENTGGCRFRLNNTNHLEDIRYDVTRMPANDVYGNALAGTYSTYSNPNPALSWFTGPADLTDVVSPRDITRASANALDNMATTIRSDSTLKPMIYTIGLNTADATAPNDIPDDQALMKLANDAGLATASGAGLTFYNAQKSQSRGMYVNAPDATQLQSAFDTIATNIVIRLSL